MTMTFERARTFPSLPGIRDATRREFLIGVGSLLMLAPYGCGNDGPSGQQGSGSWSFTDDRDVKIELDKRPERVVAYEDAAAALWPFGVRPAAVFGASPLRENRQFEDRDTSDVESVGVVYGEINLEKLAALGPDLIVVPSWPPRGPNWWGFAGADQMETVSEIAPIAAIQANRPFMDVVDRFAELARALGADLEAPEAKAARRQFDAATRSLSSAAEEKPGQKVLAASAAPEGLYVADVKNGFPDLLAYRELGLDVVVPRGRVEAGFEMLSWEVVDKYPADVVLLDARPGSLQSGGEELRGQELWRRLPAVEAGQVGTWWTGSTYDLTFFTRHLEEVTALIDRSEVVTP